MGGAGLGSRIGLWGTGRNAGQVRRGGIGVGFSLLIAFGGELAFGGGTVVAQ